LQINVGISKNVEILKMAETIKKNKVRSLKKLFLICDANFFLKIYLLNFENI